jgi:MFS family permease
VSQRAVALAVTVAALGYFVDVFDLILVNVVRGPSLASMGVAEADRLRVGEHVVNMQMLGMLVGGIAWGALGDKRGRLSVLFGSIVMYSIANLVNAAVTDLTQFEIVRFIAGVGLAGELGAGVTLVSEIMGREGRGWGPTIIAGVGILGGVAATLLGGAIPEITTGVDWRTAYVVGGVLGLVLLVLRIGVHESGMFKDVAGTSVVRGSFLALFKTGARARRYVSIVLVGLPVWYVIGILAASAPEIGKAMGMVTPPERPRALMICYLCLGVGDVMAGGLSQWLKSRRKALAVFLVGVVVTMTGYFTLGDRSTTTFYVALAAVSIAGGYWAVFVTTASEQFGTNLRATATTTAPNFVRGGLVVMNLAYAALRTTGASGASEGVVTSALIVGAVVLGLAFVGLFGIEETFGKDLDFVED